MHVNTYLGYFNELFNEGTPGSGVTDGADLTSHPVANLYNHVAYEVMWYVYMYKWTLASDNTHVYIHTYYRLHHWICQWKHLHFFGMVYFLYYTEKEEKWKWTVTHGFMHTYYELPGESASHMYTTSSWVSMAFNMSNSIRVSYRNDREGE